MMNPKIFATASIAGLALLYTGCRTADTLPPDVTSTNISKPTVAEKSGAQLWADNCNRCHNFRSPSSYNDVHWDVAMVHMRVRANLTGEDSMRILEFLKSAN